MADNDQARKSIADLRPSESEYESNPAVRWSKVWAPRTPTLDSLFEQAPPSVKGHVVEVRLARTHTGDFAVQFGYLPDTPEA